MTTGRFSPPDRPPEDNTGSPGAFLAPRTPAQNSFLVPFHRHVHGIDQKRTLRLSGHPPPAGRFSVLKCPPRGCAAAGGSAPRVPLPREQVQFQDRIIQFPRISARQTAAAQAHWRLLAAAAGLPSISNYLAAGAGDPGPGGFPWSPGRTPPCGCPRRHLGAVHAHRLGDGHREEPSPIPPRSPWPPPTGPGRFGPARRATTRQGGCAECR